MATTRTLARVSVGTVTAGWLLTTAAGAWAAPAPPDPGAAPAPPASVLYSDPSGPRPAMAGEDEAREYVGTYLNKARSYERYLAADDARAAAAAQLPTLPTVRVAAPDAAHAAATGAVRVEHTGLDGWTVVLAAAGGLLVGAGATGATARMLRTGGRLRHA
jgi:hypothetical protein